MKRITIDEYIERKKAIEMKKIEALKDFWENDIMSILEEEGIDNNENTDFTFSDFDDMIDEFTNSFGDYFFDEKEEKWVPVPY